MNDKRKTTLIQKDRKKGTAPNNYRPITCLPMMWKILTTQLGGTLRLINKLRIVTRGKEKRVNRKTTI